MSIQTDRFSMLERCFKHYIKKMKQLLDDEDLKLGNDLLKDDIQTNIEKVQYVLELLGKEETRYKVQVEYKDMMCSALETYKKDLDKVQKDVTARLSEMKPEFKNIGKEWGLIETALNDLCKK